MQTNLFSADIDMPTAGALDPTEAPTGYRAEPKVYHGENICRDCDWRAQCNDPATDLTAFGHRCVGYPISTNDGRIVSRRDGISVVFKRL